MKKAFTLVEVLVIVAIIAVLAAVTIPAVIGYKQGKPEATHLYNSSDYDVQLLFTIHDLKVYRFYDQGRCIYFVDGRNSGTAWNEVQMFGKTSVSTPVEVPTVK